MNRLERWMNREIDRYEASQRQGSPTATAQQEHTVLAKMLQRAAADPPRRADEPKFDRKRAMNNLLVLFVGGADTTAVTIGWMLYELARDQALQSEALAEAEKLAAAGKELASDGQLTSALLSSLPCLGSLFYETLRVRGPAPLENRQPLPLLADAQGLSWAKLTLHHFSDVEARTDVPVMGTPGGNSSKKSASTSAIHASPLVIRV